MAKIPEGPLGITDVTLVNNVHVSELTTNYRVGLGIGYGQKTDVSPAVARQIAQWLIFFADSAEETAARHKADQAKPYCK